MHHGAEVRREREERARHRLRGAVPGDELLVRHPARAAPPRPGAAAARRARRRRRASRRDRSCRTPPGRDGASCRAIGSADQQAEEHGERPDGERPSRRATRMARRGDVPGRRQEQPADDTGHDDHEHLRDGGPRREHGQRGDDRERRALAIGGEIPRHPPDGLRDDGDGDDLQPVQPARVRDARSPGGRRRRRPARWPTGA